MPSVARYGPIHFDVAERSGTTVALKTVGGGSTVTTYDVTGTTPSPIVRSVSGYVTFYAPPGTYELHFSSSLGLAIRKVSVTATPITPVDLLPADVAALATDAELASGLAVKQDTATAATDAELAAEASARAAAVTSEASARATADALLQPASTAATDAELASALLTTATAWAPSTVYAAGQWVIAPGGYLASAKTSFTSGGAYSASNWNEYAIGREIGYAERTTSDTTTALADDTATLNANLISGLSVTVTGIGRQVEVELYHPLVTHSVLNGVVYGTIMQDGVRIAQVPVCITKANTGQGPLIVKRRIVLVAGTSYTFAAAKTLDVAGTGTWYGNDTLQMVQYLSVTQR